MLQGQRTTIWALSQTQSLKAESDFGTAGNWKGRQGSVVFWLKVENPNHHQK